MAFQFSIGKGITPRNATTVKTSNPALVQRAIKKDGEAGGRGDVYLTSDTISSNGEPKVVKAAEHTCTQPPSGGQKAVKAAMPVCHVTHGCRRKKRAKMAKEEVSLASPPSPPFPGSVDRSQDRLCFRMLKHKLSQQVILLAAPWNLQERQLAVYIEADRYPKGISGHGAFVTVGSQHVECFPDWCHIKGRVL